MPRAHFLSGQGPEVQTNRRAQAIDESERALTLNPNLASAHALIGLAKFFDGHPEETESHELEALRASPRDTDAYFWVGWMAVAKLYLGAYEDALNLCRRANRTEPELSHGVSTIVPLWWSLADSTKRRAKSKPGLPSILISPSGAIETALKATIQFS